MDERRYRFLGGIHKCGGASLGCHGVWSMADVQRAAPRTCGPVQRKTEDNPVAENSAFHDLSF